MPSPEGMIVREGEALKNPTQSAKCLRQYVVPGVHVCMYERERFQRQRERENFQRGEERGRNSKENLKERERSLGESTLGSDSDRLKARRRAKRRERRRESERKSAHTRSIKGCVG